MRAVLTGSGQVADRLADVLAADGWAVDRAADSPVEGASLAVIVPPAGAADWSGTLEATLLAPVRLMQALADGGQPAQVVIVVDHAALVPGCVPGPRLAATAALMAAMRDAVLTLAPTLRINALALGDGADPAPSLRWLLAAQAVTGQILAPGPAPRPPTLWRSPATSPPG